MSRLTPLLLRDLLLGGLTAGLWLRVVSAAMPEAAIALQIGTALMTTLTGYLLHEWGHLIGARLAQSVVHLPDGAFASPFLFRFDTGRNTRRQFLAMSMGGFIVSGLTVAAFLALLPLDKPAGRWALGLTALGVLATFVLELPAAWRVYRGDPLPDGAAFVHSENAE